MLPPIIKLSFIKTPVELAEEIESALMSAAIDVVIVSPVITTEIPPEPTNLISLVPGVTVRLVEDSSEKVCVCSAILEKVAILVPPGFDPSCTLSVLRSVSTVTSPTAPVNVSCSAVVPLLN